MCVCGGGGVIDKSHLLTVTWLISKTYDHYFRSAC